MSCGSCNVVKNVGKGAKEETLSSRFARADLTGGDMMNRYMNNYAKTAPKKDPGVPSMGMMGMRTY